MEGIITSLIIGGLELIGVIVASVSGNKKIEHQLDKQQGITDTKLEELTREVRAHNNFAQRIPVIEEQIKVVNHRVEDLEKKVG